MANRKSLGATPRSGRPSFVPTPCDSLIAQECVKCLCKLSTKDKGLHTDSFCTSIRENVSEAIEKADHGFISGSSLHAIVSDLDIKHDDWPCNVIDAKNRVLLMNEAAMEQLSISPGDIVHVIFDDLRTTLFAHPASSLKGLCKVILPDTIHNRYLHCNSLCSVMKVSTKLIACNIHVSSEPSNFNEVSAVMSLRKRLLNLYVFKGMHVFIDVSSRQFKFTVTNVTFQQNDLSDELNKLSMRDDEITVYRMNESSRIFPQDCVNISTVSMKDVAGLHKQIDLMNECIVYPQKQMNNELKFTVPHGILLHGFTGTGKTLTVDAFINEHRDSLYCIQVDSASLVTKSADACEQKIHSLFTLAIDQAPSVIFIDRLEVICCGRKNSTDMEKQQITYFLLTQFKRLSLRRQESSNAPMVTVVGITNQLDSIDGCFRGPGKFSVEIDFPIPQAKDRLQIMTILLSRVSHDVSSDVLAEIAADAFGFTGADLQSVIERACLKAIRQNRKLSGSDLKYIIGPSKPSAMKEIILEVPAVYWSEIGGSKCIKRKLEQMVEWPFKYSAFLQHRRTEAKKGILMYGPPGCSKTMIGKALATEYKLNFLSIKGPELFNKFVGESEKSVRDLFDRARQAAPSIIFFDEIDSLAPERSNSASSSNSNVTERVVAQLLAELDGIESRSEVIVVAATNRPDIIDPALKRPGRLDGEIYVPLPDENARLEILEIKTRYMPLDESVNLRILAQKTTGYSGAEIAALCREADFTAVANVIDNLPTGMMPQLSDGKVTMDMFESALNLIKPRTSDKMIEFFENYNKNCHRNSS